MTALLLPEGYVPANTYNPDKLATFDRRGFVKESQKVHLVRLSTLGATQRIGMTLCGRRVAAGTTWKRSSWPQIDQCAKCAAVAAASEHRAVVESPRKASDRFPQVIDAQGVRHGLKSGTYGSSWSDASTLCGELLPAHDGHDSGQNMPVTDIECSGCRMIALAIPLRHTISTGRKQAGKSPIAGGGTFYATTWGCTCGVGGRWNGAPSQGGVEAAQADGVKHLREVASAQEQAAV